METSYSLMDEDDVLPPTAPQRRSHIRDKLKRCIDSIYWDGVILLLILIDLTLLIFEAILDNSSSFVFWASIGIVILFVCEIFLRIGVFGMAFFRDWWNIYDFIVVFLTATLLIILYNLGRFLIILRIVRILARITRVFVKLKTQSEKAQSHTRHLVGQNKRRYVAGGFDLDLAYITPRVIVMSTPSTNITALYRNPVSEVARFFNTNHKDKYLIVNMAEECDYPTDQFHDRVLKFPTADHNVPPLATLLEVCKAVKEWMDLDQNNVVAIHCRGGKGRSGTAICCYLLYDKYCASAQQALDTFGDERTDKSKGDKFQGVETNSQCRYVEYFAWMNNSNNLCVPPETPGFNVKSCSLSIKPGLKDISKYSNLFVSITHTKGVSLDFPMCLKRDDQESNDTTFTFLPADDQPILINKDTRFQVSLGSKGDAGILFYGWFHTFFVEAPALVLDMSQVDRGRWNGCPFRTLQYLEFRMNFRT